MKDFVAKALADALDEMGVEHELRENYSGRGMYGKTTHGIVVDGWSELLKAVALVGVRLGGDETTKGTPDGMGSDEFIDEMDSIRTDNMGRSMIVY